MRRPNAMLNHFWQKIPSFQGETKPKPITHHDPNVFHPAAICRGPIVDTVDLGLVDEFKTVSAFARKPVKITMTGPHLLAAVAYDEYYNDLPRMMADFGKLLHQNFRKLAEAGCKHIQIDEPYFTPRATRRSGRRSTSSTWRSRTCPTTSTSWSISARATTRSGRTMTDRSATAISTRGATRPTWSAGSIAMRFLIEHDMTPHYEGLLGNKQLGVGAVDVQAPNVETGEQVADRIKAHHWLAPEQTIITSSCGFNHLPRHIALGKLRAMSEAKAILSGE